MLMRVAATVPPLLAGGPLRTGAGLGWAALCPPTRHGALAATPHMGCGLKLRAFHSPLCMLAAGEGDSCDAILADASQLVSEHADAPLSPAELHHRLSALAQRSADLDTSVGAGVAPGTEAMKVAELKAELVRRGLSVSGKKAELKARLDHALSQEAPPAATPPAPTTPVSPSAAPSAALPPSVAADESEQVPLWLEEVLARTAEKHRSVGPQTGIFTDGSVLSNPGVGGWGAVSVSDGRIEWRALGSSAGEVTTNNRMEMSAIIGALRRIPASAPPDAPPTVVYSDSNLCVRTLNEWAAKWAANGWRRKMGEVQNVDLVREAYALYQARPHVAIQWRRGHNGDTWNEYADRLASAYQGAPGDGASHKQPKQKPKRGSKR
jgi:ribonuclease HI